VSEDGVQITPLEGGVGFVAETTALIGFSEMGHVWMDMAEQGKTPSQAVERLRATYRRTVEEFSERQRNRGTIRVIGSGNGGTE